MNKVEFMCKHCGAQNLFRDKKPGDGVVCSKCGRGQTIPEDAILVVPRSHHESSEEIRKASSSSETPQVVQTVIIKDIHMDMSSMVEFMIKWAFASIPAVIILGLIGGLGYLVVIKILGSL